MDSITVTRNAPAAANYYNKIGLAVYENDANEVTLATSPTAVVPFGIITKAENALGGQVTVCVAGRCKAEIGDTVTVGTHALLAVAGDSRLDPAAAGDYTIARYCSPQDGADGEYRDVIISISQLDT